MNDAKYKAAELCEKMFLTHSKRKYAGDRAIKSALIAVDEILFNIEATILYHKESIALPINKQYWEEVKNELIKLS